MTDTTQTIMTLEDVRARRDEVVALAEQYGMYNIRVCGSVARGEATPESDVDFLMTAGEGVTMFDLVGLWLDLKDLFGRDVSVITDDDDPRRERFMRRVRKDAVSL